MKIALVRAKTFSAGHRYWNPAMSEAENRAAYGSLYRDAGFGHNFRLEAHVEGVPDPMTGMIVNLVELDQWLGDVTSELDHQWLNELDAFKAQAVTPETIARYCYLRLDARAKSSGLGVEIKKVRLFEGPSLWVDCGSDLD